MIDDLNDALRRLAECLSVPGMVFIEPADGAAAQWAFTETACSSADLMEE